MKTILPLFCLLSVVGFFAEAGDIPPAANAGDGGVDFTYQLPAPGLVTLVIDNARGERVRNLIACVQREAGRQAEHWDGLDDVGQPVPAGEYHWYGIVHGPITSHFVGAFNSPGNPPWNTFQIPAGWNIRAGGAGGWLSDHAQPLCAWSDGDRIFIGAGFAEAGDSIIEMNPDGNKQWGTLWLSLSGANAIAVDKNILYVAGEKGWMKDSLAVNRLNLKTHTLLENPPDVRNRRTDACFVKEKSADFSGIRGMMVTPQFIVLSLADSGRLALFDREHATHAKDVPFPGAGAIIRLHDGSMLGISGKTVVRIDLQNGHHQPLITDHLVEPSGLGVDSRGRIYVSDVAKEVQCIQVFSPGGQWLSSIGNPGGHHEGRFDPTALGRPTALAIYKRDQIWVTENNFLPKRVSVWGIDGKLVRDYIGPPFYGGGGALDPQKAGRAFYDGMEFTWKPWPESSVLQAVLFRPEEHPDLPYPYGKDVIIPHFPVYAGKKLYLLHDEGWALPGVFIGEVVDDHLQPRVIFGSLRALWQAWHEMYPDFVSKFAPDDKPPAKGVFLWQDLNGDGRADPSEVTVQPDWHFGSGWAMRCWPALNLYAQYDKQVVMIPPKTDAAGSPDTGLLRYDLADARFTPLPEISQKYGIGGTFPDMEGNLLVNWGAGGQQGDAANVFMSLAPDGKVRWTYPNPYPGNWHNSPLPHIGDIQHTLNVEGLVSIDDKTHIFQLNGNKGLRYLFTTDGLFVAQLFADMRQAPMQQNLLQASAGMRLDQNSLGDECFSGWLGQGPDGRILQVVGKDSSNVTEVRGLDSITRLAGGPVTLKQGSHAADQQQTGAPKPIQTIFAGWYKPGWEKLSEYEFPPKEPVAHFAISYQANGLRLWMSVQDETPFENNGQDINTLFHTGDAIDFRIAANPNLPANREKPQAGDSRFVIAMFKGNPVVVHYAFVAPGGVGNPVKFASPTGVEQVDRVSVVANAKVNVTRTAKVYEITVDIPWTEIGFEKPPAGTLLGDVGVIFGDPTSSRAVMRAYYFDQESQVVSDIPSETRVTPARWGKILF